MRDVLVYAILLFFLHPAPDLRAVMTNDGGVVVEWTQPASPALTCLYHKRGGPAVLYTCWSDLPVGEIRTVIRPPFDAAQRPGLGSIYILTRANVEVSRALLFAPVYLPVATRGP